jgi:lipopolysaccharide transport system permease protein
MPISRQRTLTPSSLAKTGDSSWDYIIRPRTGWFELNLHELWRYRSLILLFVRRDFIAQYKQTILGPLWFFFTPIFATIINTIIFGNLANLSTDGLPKFLFYLSGNVAWGYFSICFSGNSNTLFENTYLFGKVYFPRLAPPLSKIISNLIQFGLKFCLLLGFVVYFIIRGNDVRPNIAVFLIPILLLIMAALGLGVGLLFSSISFKYRDFQRFVVPIITAWMYATPVVYPLSILDNSPWRSIIAANPLTPVIESFRFALLGVGKFIMIDLLYSFFLSIVVLFTGIVVFNRVEKTFIDSV